LPQPDDSRTLTLRDYVSVIWIRKWLIAVIIVAFTAFAFVYAHGQTPTYQATASLIYQPPANITNPTGTSSIDTNSLTVLLQGASNSVNDPAVRSRAAGLLGAAYAHVGYAVTASVVTPAGSASAVPDLVQIATTSTSAEAAAKISNAYASAVIAIRKESQQASYHNAQVVIENQLKLFSTASSHLTSTYQTLLQSLSLLQIAEASANGDFALVVPAIRPASPSSPHPIRYAGLGFAAGLLVGIGLAFVLGQLDTRIRTYREVGETLGLPILGRVPRISRHTLQSNALVALTEPHGNVSEALRMLRSNLEWASVDEPLQSLLFTSCLKGEGKTVTLCNLAITLARAGKRVVVVDADLRDPQVHKVFNLPNAVGVTSVVLGTATLQKALQVLPPPTLGPPDAAAASAGPGQPTDLWDSAAWQYELEDAFRALEPEKKQARTTGERRMPDGPAASNPGPRTGSVFVLTSGPLPPDPGEVVASHRLGATLKEISHSAADLVLIDAPPILGVGDAAALAKSAGGVLLVVRLDKAKKPTLLAGRESLEHLPCRRIGTVVVGESLDGVDYYTRKTKPISARSKG
jgi:Mrp family chromosome partitioning ATPase/capsular polysaccharide biosynthesis protein